MKKKIYIAIGIIAIAALAIFGFNQLAPKQTPVEGAKAINIVVMDSTQDNKELYKGTIHTDAETLGDALVEAKDIKMVTEESAYGRYIVALCDVSQGSQEAGPWWLYESDNNESCKAQGMCMGIDETVIKDGDNFTFNLTADFN
ncbi:hypothetical protein [Anaerorhabdus sp.]|jgi:hypothetical protein|uniref:hypothetical protein n=1 Tax=Anaerorhabdus sp. TaxID=1872524 RepID=UPI002FCC09DD